MPTRIEILKVNADIMLGMEVQGVHVTPQELKDIADVLASFEALLTVHPEDTFLRDNDEHPMTCHTCPTIAGYGSDVDKMIVYDEHTMHSHHIECRYLKARQAYDKFMAGGNDADTG